MSDIQNDGQKENNEAKAGGETKGSGMYVKKEDAVINKGMSPMALLITLVLIGAAFYFMPMVKGLINGMSGGGQPQEEQVQDVTFGKHLTTQIIKDEVLKQEKLVTYTDTFEITVDFSNNTNFPWTEIIIPGARRELSITLPVTIDITTDLSAMQIDYDEATDTATVLLPLPEIFRITPDIAALNDEQHVGLFRRKMTADEQQDMIVVAEDRARDAVNDHNLLELAGNRAEGIVSDIIKQLDVQHVEISTLN